MDFICVQVYGESIFFLLLQKYFELLANCIANAYLMRILLVYLLFSSSFCCFRQNRHSMFRFQFFSLASLASLKVSP